MKFIRGVIAASFLCLLIGCSGSQVKLVPVSGSVKIDGKPAANIFVMFMPNIVDESVRAPSSQAITNESGEFKLFTAKNEEGAIEGVHLVSLYDTEEERPAQGEVATKPPRLDPKYASNAITVEVVKDGEPIVLEATGPG